MDIEEEARVYGLAKKTQFSEALREHASLMELYLRDNLHRSDELDNALRSLQAAILWAEEAAEMHGIK